MQEHLSYKGNIIKYDEKSFSEDIEDILLKRFNGDFNSNSSLDDLHNPYLLCGMRDAVERIKKAKEFGQKVMIFGDYDVDGVTSTSILMHFFKKVGILASYRLPHRIDDGYGIKSYFIDEFSSIGVDLVITVDCGTRDTEVVKYAKSKGIDVIITDHHTVPDIIPDEAIALINPKRGDCVYPFKHLSGAGVAFKLMSALAEEFLDKKEIKKYIEETIDITAIGTVADCMLLVGENRIIVEAGLKQIKKSRSRGIRKLIEQKIHDDLDSDIFSYLIGPKLNAAGRMDTPYKAINLILNNSDSVEETIQEIELLNDNRKQLTFDFFEKALENINSEDNIIFYDSKDITHGIIGIVAGKLTEKFYRPSIVLKEESDRYIASCRSPDYFSIVDILEKYQDYFLRYGGHKQAAGFSIAKERYDDFKNEILKDVNSLDFKDQKKSISVDKIVSMNELGFNFLEKVNIFKPFGLGNTKPVFMVKDLDYQRIVYLGQGIDHIKFETKYGFKIIAFGMGQFMDKIKSSSDISIIFELNLDNYNGNKNLQLNIIDII
ncbi:single-stranded-DNA-specific exonuclease RecJ [Candidatus Gracilibacteria bacterium]|nr:single-stranded-DNA-specific exonuclease RecJ [Candidatus Gracilibacteria bacterium]